MHSTVAQVDEDEDKIDADILQNPVHCYVGMLFIFVYLTALSEARIM
jgi:hypothetical protein